MSHVIPLDQWADVLEAVVARSVHLSRVVVFAETDSTQEACRRLGHESGLVVVTGRQTTGRGRLGRTWLDTYDDGVAVSLVLNDDLDNLPLAAPVATAVALETVLGEPVSLKWPNDVLSGSQAGALARRKLAGILIERTGGVSVLGIGINVGQKSWPEIVADQAVSLQQLGCVTDRLIVLEQVLTTLDRQLARSSDDLLQDWSDRDALRGQHVTVSDGTQQLEGIVEATDPTGVLRLVSQGQVVEVASGTATITSV